MMLKAGIIGLGYMGRSHLACYRRLEQEGAPVRLAALCDADTRRFENTDIIHGSTGATSSTKNAVVRHFSDYREMLASHDLDFVDITLPTMMHAEVTIAALEAGLHVICEKPMARTEEQCSQMIETAHRSGKKMMVAHCLRFWPAYEYIKKRVEQADFGRPLSAYFFRGGSTPKWSWNNWLLDGKMSGGCLMDQHVHDVDMVQWLFGMPEAVSCVGRHVIPGSGYDAVSARYKYRDGQDICAEDDWTIEGSAEFNMLYRFIFEKGNINFENGRVTVYPAGAPCYVPEMPADDGYYREISYFVDCIIRNKDPERCMPESTRDTIRLVLAEQCSADNGGSWEAIL